MGGSSSFVLIAFLSLTLFACIIEAREIPTNDVALNNKPTKDFPSDCVYPSGVDKTEPKESAGGESFKKDFELERPSFLYYHNGDKTEPNQKSAGGESFKKDFELERPSAHLFFHYEDKTEPKLEKPLIKLFNKGN